MSSIHLTEILAFSKKKKNTNRFESFLFRPEVYSTIAYGAQVHMALFLAFQTARPSDSVLKTFLQGTDPLVTNAGPKQEAFKADKRQTCLLPEAEFKTQQK